MRRFIKTNKDEENLTPKEFTGLVYSEICAALLSTLHIMSMGESAFDGSAWYFVIYAVLFLIETAVLTFAFSVLGTLIAKEHKHDSLKKQRQILFIILPIILTALFLLYVHFSR